MNPKLFINFIAFSLILINLSLCYYLFIRYGFDLINLGTEIKLYYTILILGFFFLLVLIFVKVKTAYKIILLYVSIAFSIYTFDFFLYYFNFVHPPHLNPEILKVAEEKNIPYDKRNKWEVLKDMRRNDTEAWPVVYPVIWLREGPLKYQNNEIFPFASVSNSKLVHCNESGTWTSYISDKYGFNNSSNVYQNEIDIALIGDSFTEGACVDRSLNIASSIAKNNSFNVVNFGKGGSGALVEYAILKEYALPLKPKNLVWLLYENDISETIAESENVFLKKYHEENYLQNLTNMQSAIDSSLKKHINQSISLRSDSNFKQFIRLWHIRSLIKQIFYNEDTSLIDLDYGVSLVFDLIVKAEQEVNKTGGNFIFVYLPSRETLVNSNEPEHLTRLIKRLENRKISVINMQNIISNSNRPVNSFFYFGIENHYNEFGYKLVADAISDEL